MNIVRKLFLVTAKFDFEIKLVHIKDRLNSLSDSLSRMQINRFRDLFPDAKEEPTILDPAVWDGLLPEGNSMSLQPWLHRHAVSTKWDFGIIDISAKLQTLSHALCPKTP